jgi:hypothetical protein
MDLSDLRFKIERLYEAVATTVELDLSKFPPILGVAGNWVSVRQDFNRALNQAQLNNAAFQVVRAIADLKDHLRSAARRLKLDLEDVERTIDGSLPPQLMIDLANFDKHSQHDKVGAQRSKRSPRLINVRGAIQISTRAGDLGPGGIMGIQLTPQGAKPFGTGKAAVIITGEIVDESGNQILELSFAQTTAVAAWESLFPRLRIPVRGD